MNLIKLAIGNLFRNKIRATLTISGVVIGIAALFSMVSFGTGLENNILKVFYENDLFTNLSITSQKLNFANARNVRKKIEKDTLAPPLNDSLIKVLAQYPEIEIIYPQVLKTVKVSFNGNEQTSEISGLPATMAKYKPYNQIENGSFFKSDSDNFVIVNQDFLRSLIQQKDTGENSTPFIPKDYVGKEIEVTSVSVGMFNPMAMMSPFGLPSADNGPAITQQKLKFKIGGILNAQRFNGTQTNGDILFPLKTLNRIPSLGFNNITELLSGGNKKNQYSMISVRAKGMTELDSLKNKLKKQHINYLSVSDQLTEIKKGFTVVQSILGIIGVISLFVAGLGIVNTMLMSVLERTREIGIMKSIGAEEGQIRLVFLYEAALIGAFGSLGGMLLGWGGTLLANKIVNQSLVSKGNDPVDLFSFPVWLIAGAFVFGTLMALLAGLYPAVRASRIDPVEAIRQN